jgi:adenylate cyclase
LVQLSLPTQALTRRLRAVLFVDVVESVRLISQDAEGTIQRWRDFMAGIVQEELPRRRGRMVKALGDGMLVEFESTVDAVECALAMQSRIEAANSDRTEDQRIQLRIGVHLADVMADDIDLYGDGVNLAARLMTLAGPREIIISAAVRDQLTDGLGVTIEDLGERRLKGMEKPVRAFRAWPSTPTRGRAVGPRKHAGDRPSIAVLPFRNLSRDPAHDFLGDLIAEDVIGDLSRLTDLFVISRLSTTPLRDRLYEPRSVADMLGVRYVLSGSIHTSGTRLRLTAELTEAEAASVIWSDRFEGSLTDIFELQDQLSHDIAKRVVPYVKQLELIRARSQRPENLTAYERTLRAIDHLHRTSPEDMAQAREMLEAAIASDPSYVTPYAWLARWHVLRVGQGMSPDLKLDTLEANRRIETAMQLDATNPWAISVYGLVSGYLNHDLEKAISMFDRALTINPSAVSAWGWSTSAYAWLGKGAEAVRRSQKAIELSPFDPHMYSFTAISAVAHMADGRFEEAVDWCQRSLRENRMYSATYRILAASLALSGRVEEAKGVVGQLLALEPEMTLTSFRERYPGRVQVEQFCEGLALAGLPR